MKNKQQPKKTSIRMIALSLSLIGTAHAANTSPFSLSPLHLREPVVVQNVTSTQQFSITNTRKRVDKEIKFTARDVKPNVMLVLDNSASMRCNTDSSETECRTGTLQTHPQNGKPSTRWRALYEATNTIFSKYGDRANFGLQWFSTYGDGRFNWNNTNWPRNIRPQPIGTSVNEIRRAVENSQLGWGTPTVESYLDGINAFNDKVEHRCQKNYLILMSDGESDVGYPHTQNFSFKQVIGSGQKNGDIGGNGNSLGNYVDRSGKASRTGQWEALLISNGTYGRQLEGDSVELPGVYSTWLNINYKLNANPIAANAMRKKYGSRDAKSADYQALCGYTSIDKKARRSDWKRVCNWLKSGDGTFAFYPYTGIVDSRRYTRLAPNNKITFEPTKNTLAPHHLRAGNMSNPNRRDYMVGAYIYDTPFTNSGTFPAFTKEYPKINGANMLSYISTAIKEYDPKNNAPMDANGRPWDHLGSVDRSITTFTISLGKGVSDVGRNMLELGSTSTLHDKQGNKISYVNATNNAELSNAFDKIFEAIVPDSQVTEGQTIDLPPEVGEPIALATPPATAGAINIAQSESYASVAPNYLGGSEKEVASLSATIYLPPGLRSSQLRFYEVNSDGTLKRDPTTNNVSFSLPDFSQRRALVTYNSAKNYIWAHQLPENRFSDQAYFHLEKVSDKHTQEWREALLPWVTRTSPLSDDQISNMRYRNSLDSYRVRPAEERDMGDVLDSPIVAAGSKDAKNGGRQEFLITAANDGMVYLFQSNPNQKTGNGAYSPYILKLNYLPMSLVRDNDETIASTLQYIAHKKYGTNDTNYPHKYLLNGGITVRTTNNPNKKQKIFLAGNAGQGARGMYALNVGGVNEHGQPIALSNPNPDAWPGDVPLFEVNGKEETQLGYTVGSPQIARIRMGNNDIRQTIFLSSGFAHPSPETQETALYLYSAFPTTRHTPDRIAKVSLGNTGGLATPTILDVNYDGIADYAFAGDFQGNLYRFDLRNPTNGNIPFKKIYQGNASQPITSAPAVSLQEDGRYVIVFGTGSDMFEHDYKNKAQQAVYGIYQAFKEKTLDPINPNNPAQPEDPNALVVGNLLKQEFSQHEQGATFRTVTNHEIFTDPKAKIKTLKNLGWYVPLGATDGERVVVKPEILFGTVFLATRIYKESTAHLEFNPATEFNAKNPATNGWVKVGDTQTSEKTYSPSKDKYTDWRPDPNADETKVEHNPNDRCLDTVTTNIRGKIQTQTISYSETSQYKREISTKTNTTGWLITLNTVNGGQLNYKDVGVDFGRQGLDINIMRNKKIPFISGTMFNGIPNQTLLSAAVNRDSAVSHDGDSGGSGQELQIGAENQRAEGCLAKDGVHLLLPNSTITGVQDPFVIKGKGCGYTGKPYIRRLSWYELY